VSWDAPRTHRVELEAKEVTALLATGVGYRFWTFNGTVPGPMLRVRQGDAVELTLKNAPGTRATHSINIHAVSGPGGGAWVSQVGPGDASAFRFQATRPGVYVYHCMTPPVGQHVANGMYGLVVVEPPQGLAPVDREWYVMQGDVYLQGGRGQPGMREFGMAGLVAEKPDYVIYNGGVGALAGERALRAKVGERVRVFFGVGGPNLDSAFHVVGGIFDRLWPEGASEPLTNVQTTLVSPGSAAMAELTFDAPGRYMIEDHHITRLEKGAMAEIVVEGAENPDVFRPLPPGSAAGAGR
jgi:nitrite reductase (NO-forming)